MVLWVLGHRSVHGYTSVQSFRMIHFGTVDTIRYESFWMKRSTSRNRAKPAFSDGVSSRDCDATLTLPCE